MTLPVQAVPAASIAPLACVVTSSEILLSSLPLSLASQIHPRALFQSSRQLLATATVIMVQYVWHLSLSARGD